MLIGTLQQLFFAWSIIVAINNYYIAWKLFELDYVRKLYFHCWACDEDQREIIWQVGLITIALMDVFLFAILLILFMFLKGFTIENHQRWMYVV